MTRRRRPPRTRLATGVYQDVYGIGIVVRGKEHRYPRGTPLEELRRARRELLEDAGPPTTRRGTLDADIDAYLLLLPEGPRRRDAANLLRHWANAPIALDGRPRRLGTLSRHALTAVQIEQQLTAWHGQFSPGTRKHLRRELGALYRRLNGKAGANPVRDVPQIPVRYEEPRAIPYPVIAMILAAMPNTGRPTGAGEGTRPTVSLTKLRHTIAAYQGLTPAMIGRVRARDLNLRAGTVYVRPRRKGTGTSGQTQPLTPQAAAAFARLLELDALGPYDTRGPAKTWQRALAKAKRAWETDPKTKDQPWPAPEDARPYDVRHSFASAVMRRTRNLHAVASLLMHSSLTTTRRYLQGVVDEESAAAVDAVAVDLTAPPAAECFHALPRRAVKMAQNGRQRPSVAAKRRRAS